MLNLVVLASTGENLSEGQPSKSASFKPQFRRGILFFNMHNVILYDIFMFEFMWYRFPFMSCTERPHIYHASVISSSLVLTL